MRILITFALGVVATLLAFTIRALAAPADSGLESGELVVLSGADDSVGGQRQRLIDEWNRAHPDNPARLESLSSEADRQHSEMVARAQSGASGVDVYNLDVTWIAEFAAANFIQSLDDSVSTEGFLPEPLATCRFEDKLWALPFNTDAGLLYYRTDLIPTADELPKQLPPSKAETRKLADAADDRFRYTDPTVRQARPYADALLDAVHNARPRPLTTHYALFSSVFQDVASEALKQGELPDDAVSRLTDALQGRLR